jgi:hypothetical protein
MSLVRLDPGLLALSDLDLRCKVIFSIPPPQFPRKIPASRRLSSSPHPLLAARPDPSVGAGERPRWTRYPVDERPHLLAPVDVVLAATAGRAQALCGRRIPAEGLTLGGPSRALCVSCIAAGTSPGAPTMTGGSR